MLLFPSPPDEHQLTNYILLFKGTQFFTSGVIALFLGAMQYYRCYIRYDEDMRHCILVSGPGASESVSGQIFDYCGSVVLVWVSFINLPRSRRVRAAGANADILPTPEVEEQ